MIPSARQALLLSLLAVCLAAPGRAQFVTIHDEPGTRQVTTDGQSVFVLKDDGRILQFSSGAWQTVDTGAGTVQIAADEGRLYALKDDGRLHARVYGAWAQIGTGGSRQLVALGRDLYTLDRNDEAWFYASKTREWTKVDDGSNTRMVAADAQAGLVVLKNSGNIWQRGTRWNLLDDGTGTRAVVASAGCVYALKDNGNVWRHSGSWEKADDGADNVEIAAAGTTLYCLKQGGALSMSANGQTGVVDSDPANRHVVVRGEVVLLVRSDGKVLMARSLEAAATDPRQEKFQKLYQE